MTPWRMQYGSTLEPAGGARLRVWAPLASNLGVRINGGDILPMQRNGEDFELLAPGAKPGDRYGFVFDDLRERPDPVSRSQPQGVHAASEIVDPDSFSWSDSHWRGLPLSEYVIYELHPGAFTEEGTFHAVLAKLAHLQELGITAIELMPVAEFPGSRNWGYDGVDLYAPHSAYGGPIGLKQLVNACHQAGLAVILDVVYNHIGPEGNYLGEFGPYFTQRYQTPWGAAINFDGPGSDGVRRFFIENALYWLTEFHIDALRLDAIHGIVDLGARHVLAELGERFHEQAQALGRQAYLIAESDLNDVRVLNPRSMGGYEIDAQWHDEFHHAVRSYVTRAEGGFLGQFGRLEHIRKAIAEGFVYDGIYSPYRGRHFGSSSAHLPGERFVIFLQNHDQIANTSHGARLSHLVDPERVKLAAALLLCSPGVPLLFMGEEFAETSPFLYFTSHADRALAAAVSEGRLREYADFVSADFPDPQDPRTFEKSKLSWALLDQPVHRAVLRLYRDLIALRKQWPCLRNGRKDLTRIEINEEQRWLRMERGDPGGTRATLLCNFSGARLGFAIDGEPAEMLQTASPDYGGQSLAPLSEVAAYSATVILI